MATVFIEKEMQRGYDRVSCGIPPLFAGLHRHSC